MTAADALERWRSEKTAAFLSSAVAAAEPDPVKAALFKRMAEAAEEQAGILATDLGRTPDFTPSMRSRLIATCIATFGPRAMRHILSATKVHGVSVYSGQDDGSRRASLAEVRRRYRQAAPHLWRWHVARRRVRRE
jgi:vacuolar iron transporter family protein